MLYAISSVSLSELSYTLPFWNTSLLIRSELVLLARYFLLNGHRDAQTFDRLNPFILSTFASSGIEKALILPDEEIK